MVLDETRTERRDQPAHRALPPAGDDEARFRELAQSIILGLYERPLDFPVEMGGGA
jgi:hypothetical protein